MYIHMYLSLSPYVCIHTCMHIYICVYMCIYIYIHTCMYVYVLGHGPGHDDPLRQGRHPRRLLNPRGYYTIII